MTAPGEMATDEMTQGTLATDGGAPSDRGAASILWERGVSGEGLFGTGRTVPVATLGPVGTSAMVALAWLAERVLTDQHTVIDPRAYPTFDALLDAVTGGTQRLVLIPSAAECATRFFWSPHLRLLASFSWPTPRYGLAVRPDGPAPAGATLRVSSLSETRDLLELLPRGRQIAGSDSGGGPEAGPAIEWVAASSTYDAAQLAARGAADVAVTNELGRAAGGLRFVASRPGVAMIWHLFGRRPERDDAPGDGTDHGFDRSRAPWPSPVTPPVRRGEA